MIEAARREQWESVDGTIAGIVDDPRYYKWAHSKGIRDRDGNVRDLAVSILERSIIPDDAFSAMGRDLHELMLKDDNTYVRFRAAFAFASHGPQPYREEVIRTLREAAKDRDIGFLAKDYLSKLRTRVRS